MGESDQAFLEIGDDLADLLERSAGLDGGSSVLDVGCGYGRLPHALLRRGFLGRYLGIDVVKRSVRWCRRSLSSDRIEFRHVDAHNERYNPRGSQRTHDVKLGGECFDVVAVFSVFTHLWPEDLKAYLWLIASSLRPTGQALATFFLLDDEWRRLRSEGRAGLDMPHTRTRYCRFQSKDEPLHRVGYELEWVLAEARTYGLIPVRSPELGWWARRQAAREPSPGYQDAITFALAASDVA